MISSISIKGLFENFNYKIAFEKSGITILTGPNGFGKTTILKIIQSMANGNYLFLFKLSFKTIEIGFTNRSNIRIVKENAERLSINDEHFTKNEYFEKYLSNMKNNRFHKVDKDRWFDRSNERIITMEEIISRLNNDTLSIDAKESFEFPVYMIKEQRLLKQNYFKKNRDQRYYIEDNAQVNEFAYTIEEYAKELKGIISQTLSTHSILSQELDSSFPRRLFDEKEVISEELFSERFKSVKEIQKRLNTYNITVSKGDNQPIFKKENAKALLVYLNDSEMKLKTFNELLAKLDIFIEILNVRRLTYKKLEIDREVGFKAIGERQKDIPLVDLSSGEQHEIVLFYELLFRVEPNSLVMIDEPELSLHVAWQKEFLNDITRIANMKKITIVLATHSPQIIADKWESVYDLMENGNA